MHATKPVEIVVQKDNIVAFMEDGSVWYTGGVDKKWTESEPIPGTDRWNTWPEEKNDRTRQPVRRGSHSTFDQG